jgi:hypothetical protein
MKAQSKRMMNPQKDAAAKKKKLRPELGSEAPVSRRSHR